MAEATRVALLARPGGACERLQAALHDAGANVVLVADPTASDAAGVRAAGAQAVLVALEPLVEDVLERFDEVLGDPAITVIFDEAELAAQREGWDAARWVRHLAAKLRGHADVLPPGAEAEAPELGATTAPALYQRQESDLDLAGFVAEAEELGMALPQDAIASTGGAAAGEATASHAFDPVAFEFDGGAPGGGEFAPGFDGAGLAPIQFDDGNDAGAAAAPAVEAFDVTGLSLDGLALDEGTAAAPGVDDAPAASPFTGLSLEEIEPPASPDDGDDQAARHRFQRDLDDLEARIAGMELVDAPRQRSPAQALGAVVVLAGIGGPDAVRQLLGGLPAGFPRPVLIQQRLDGARHDKLVRQMQRATAMPVHLAAAGAALEPGNVYVLPAELGVVAGATGLQFGDGGDVLAGLPSADSAVILLSGSDPAAVDPALGHAARGALVAGQSPDGCYDAAAPEMAIARGGEAGSPVELARKLAARWPA